MRNAQLPSTPAPAEPKLEALIGAEAIAAALGIGTLQLKRLRQNAKSAKDAPDRPPIEKRPGLGLVAERATLLAWWARYLGAAA